MSAALSRRVLIGAASGVVAASTAAASPAAALSRRRQVIVFTKTAAFRHNSIPTAISTLKELGAARGMQVVATEDSAIFTRRRLRSVAAIVFANTTGTVLTDPQKAAVEHFVRSGGGWMGVHAAADTEYEWPFYGELLSGGWFKCHPLVNQPGTLVRESATHRSTAHLPARWELPADEFYSFRRSVRGTAKVLLSMDEKSYVQDPNTTWLPSPSPPYLPTLQSGRMGDHPMCWQRKVGRGISWYTALGHTPKLYDDPAFRQHLLGGLVTVFRHGRANLPRR